MSSHVGIFSFLTWGMEMLRSSREKGRWFGVKELNPAPVPAIALWHVSLWPFRDPQQRSNSSRVEYMVVVESPYRHGEIANSEAPAELTE
jgi:hypothetical protein